MGYDRVGADHRALANRNTLQNARIESDPGLVFHLDRRVRDMLPVLPTLTPIDNIIAALFPAQIVGIVIHDRNSPGHDDVIANLEASVAYEVTSSDERTVSYPDLATGFLETDVGMNNRIFADGKGIAPDVSDPAPRD